MDLDKIRATAGLVYCNFRPFSYCQGSGNHLVALLKKNSEPKDQDGSY